MRLDVQPKTEKTETLHTKLTKDKSFILFYRWRWLLLCDCYNETKRVLFSKTWV